jgi:hypothetical protein
MLFDLICIGKPFLLKYTILNEEFSRRILDGFALIKQRIRHMIYSVAIQPNLGNE